MHNKKRDMVLLRCCRGIIIFIVFVQVECFTRGNQSFITTTQLLMLTIFDVFSFSCVKCKRAKMTHSDITEMSAVITTRFPGGNSWFGGVLGVHSYTGMMDCYDVTPAGGVWGVQASNAVTSGQLGFSV